MSDPSVSDGTDLYSDIIYITFRVVIHYMMDSFSGSVPGFNVTGTVPKATNADFVTLNGGNNYGGNFYIPYSSLSTGSNRQLYTDSSYLIYIPNENRLKTGSVYCSSGGYNYFSGNVAIGYSSGTLYLPLDVRGYYAGSQTSNMWNASNANHNDGFFLYNYGGDSGLSSSNDVNGHFRNYDLDVESNSTVGIWKAYITAHFKYSIYCSNGGFMVVVMKELNIILKM